MSTMPISDDDICSDCLHCVYQPGDESNYMKDFPGARDQDGYITSCSGYWEQEYSGQNLPIKIWLRQFPPVNQQCA